MIAPRWRKALRDVLARPGRSILAVLAMAAGVFESSAMLYKYAVLQPELTQMYGRTHPASATLSLDHVTDALVDSVRRVRGVADVEARPVVVARVRVGQDEWTPAVFWVVRDFERPRIDTYVRDQGAWPPADDALMLERSALQVAGVEPGDSLTVRVAGDRDLTLRVGGTVHAAGLAPAWMEHMVPGFVAWNSPIRGGATETAQLRIVVADHPLDEGWIREVADSVQAMLVRGGHEVGRITVPTPGLHPHAGQMAAFLYLLLAFGILSFVLGAVLAATMVQAWMAEQIKQIGTMKAVGATQAQIAGIYLAQVAMLAAAAVVVGLPLGILLGRAYAQFAAGILNADISRAPFPWAMMAAVVMVGVLVPLVTALVPVRRAARITVREALSDEPGMRRAAPPTDAWIAWLAWLPRPLALSLRSTFARRGRVVLTVGMLSLGGAAFISALNVAYAWTRAVEADFASRRYDLMVGLTEARSIATLERVLATVPAVEHAEFWPGASPYLIGAAGVPGGTVSLVGPEPSSRLLTPAMEQGRWLEPGDTDAAVVNRAVLTRHGGLGMGDSVRVRIQGRNVAFAVVGVAKELYPMPVIYAPRGAVLAATGQSNEMARSIRVVTRGHDDLSQRAAARELERAFASEGITVSGMQRMQDAKQGILDHLVIILSVLTAAALVVVVVGSLALTSTLTLNVIQRTREIGVLGAIGATPRTIASHVWFEAMVFGALSWAVANLMALPSSWLLETVTGRIFFGSPLDFRLSPVASALWLLLVVVLATASSVYPAQRAARLSVREALAHV